MGTRPTGNLWIRETYLNATEGYISGEGEWIETSTDDLGELYRELKSQYGNAHNIYVGEGQKVGWCFTGRARYEDTGEAFTQEVWVNVSTTEPRRVVRFENVSNPWSAA